MILALSLFILVALVLVSIVWASTQEIPNPPEPVPEPSTCWWCEGPLHGSTRKLEPVGGLKLPVCAHCHAAGKPCQ